MELFKLLGTIAIDNDPANKALNETSKKAKESAKETEDAFTKIGGVAGNIAKGIGAAGLAIGGSFIAAVEGTREYRIEMGKLDTAFVTNGHSSEAAKKTYSDLNAVLGDSGQAVEAANHLAVLTDNEADLKTWTEICTGVYATFGDSLPIEGLTEAANETAKVGQVTGPLADALNWAGISEDEFNEKLAKCSGEQERQKLIMETLNGTYSKASEQYKKTNKDVIASEKANERLKDALAKVGEVGEPVITAVKNAFAGLAEKAVPVIVSLIEKIKDFSTWVKDNEEKVKLWSGVIGIAAATVAGFVLVLSWATIMKKAASALKIVTIAVKALNVAMRANIIGLVVTAILGLVAAFIYLWKNCEGFRKFWIGLWKIILSAAKSAWKSISKAWEGAGKWFKSKFEQVQNAGKNAMDKVKKWFSDAYKSVTKTFSNVGGWFRGKFQSAWSSIKSVFSGWGSFFGGLWSKIKSKFSSIGSALGKAMGDSVKSGVNKVFSLIEKTINKGIGYINSAIKLANKLPGINVGTLSKISLPRLEKGGVLERGQVGLLEGTGAEAVVPLEHNRAWLSKVADDLNEIQENRFQNGNSSQIINLLNRAVDLLEDLARMKIYLDNGVLVGELTPAIDGRLSDRYIHATRGNTR